ncbi:MAG: CBS domain-containing protein, partial [Candidatus Binatia bacterium]
VMSRKLFLVTPQTPTREALRIILERRVGCTPVIRGSTLVGILTTRDLLWAMAGQLAPKALAPKKQQARRSPSVRARGTPRAKAKSRRR